MIYFERSLGDDGSYAKYYFQQQHQEIDSNRVYPTIVICPGGAYLWTSYREDEVVALRFLSEGFHVVVVHYATEGIEKMSAESIEELPQNPKSRFPLPLVTLAKAVAFLRKNKEQYAVDDNFIIVAGFSAGGNLAAQLGVYWHTDWLSQLVGVEKALYQPTHLMLGYGAFDIYPNAKEENYAFNRVAFATTGQQHVTEDLLKQVNPIKHVSNLTPPSFVWHTNEDMLVSSNNALQFCQQLAEYQVPYELHIFQKGKHGLVLGDLRTGVKKSNQNAQVSKWVDLFLEWIYPYKTQLGGFYQGKEG